MPPVVTSLLPLVDLPPTLITKLKSFNEYFPDKVKWNSIEKSVQVTEEMPFELKLAMTFLNLATDINGIVENLNLVLDDLSGLASLTTTSEDETSRRYFLLVRVFFYELLRVRDALPRFLKRLEGHGVMPKGDRREARKTLDEVLSELYLIRNVFLHADSFPLTDDEFDLKFMASAASMGYELTPSPGQQKLPFPELLRKLTTWRRTALQKVASDVVALCQRLIDTTAEILVAKHFSTKGL